MKNSSWYSFFLIHYFIQSAVGIAYEPLDYILKDRLRLSAGEAAGFLAWMTLPLLFKPLAGLAADFLPWGGYRRKPHIFLGAMVAAMAFFGAAVQHRYSYISLLLPLTLTCFAMAYADAACGGLLVHDGNERLETGRYQALQIGALYLGALLTGAGSGWLTTHVPFPWIFAISGVLPLAIVAALQLIREPISSVGPVKDTGSLRAFLQTKKFWALSLTILLWNFYPFLGTVQFYYQSSVLRLSPQWIGSLMSVGALMGLAGSAAYWRFCRTHDAGAWVYRGPVMMALASLTYLFYQGPVSVTVVESLYGFASVFFRLILFYVIARACPQDAEATVYALLMVLFDLSMYASNALGGRLYDFFQSVFNAQPYRAQLSGALLVLIGSLSTLACRWTLPERTLGEVSL